jgi:hypothetical protein
MQRVTSSTRQEGQRLDNTKDATTAGSAAAACAHLTVAMKVFLNRFLVLNIN